MARHPTVQSVNDGRPSSMNIPMLRGFWENPPSQEKFFRFFFILIAAVLLFVMPAVSLDFGITFDEWVQAHYGRLILKFFMSGGADRECLEFMNLYWYGGLFDAVSSWVYGVMTGDLKGYVSMGLSGDIRAAGLYETRHALNAFLGYLGMLLTGLMAYRLGGARAGCLSFIFIFLSPRFFGHSMNNPKDIPFAAGYATFFYFMILFLDAWPRVRKRVLAGLLLGLVLAVGTRVGGIILLFYFAVFGVWEWYARRREIRFFRLMGMIILISAVGYFMALLFWPYGLMDPVRHPWQALRQFSHATSVTQGHVLMSVGEDIIPVKIPITIPGGGGVLFEGAIIANNTVPWYYLPKWIGMTVPLSILAGIVLFLLYTRSIIRRSNPRLWGMLILGAGLPVLVVILQRSALYNEWRHFLFIYPLLVAMASLGWDHAFRAGRAMAKVILGIVLFLFLTEPAAWMVRNHPHAYMYFNPLVGGLKGVAGFYEMDYWGHCLREASRCLAEDYSTHRAKERVQVHADGPSLSSAYYLHKWLGSAYDSFGGSDPREIDFYIMLPKAPEMALMRQKKDWAPQDTVCRVSADEVTLCAVRKNPRV